MTSLNQGPPTSPAGRPAGPRLGLFAGCAILVLALFGGAMWLGHNLTGPGRTEGSAVGVPSDPGEVKTSAPTAESPWDEPDADESEPSGAESQEGSVPSADASAPDESPSAADPTATVQSSARRTLDQLADDGSATVSLDGRRVAMLASKWNGVRDPLQKSASGSHVFHYSDILAEHNDLADGDNLGASVVLLRSTDYGKHARSPNGKVMYVTFAYSADFTSSEDVQDWCDRRFSELTDKERANNCVPTRLTD